MDETTINNQKIESWRPTTLILGSICTETFPHLIYPQLGSLMCLCNNGVFINLKRIVGVNIGALIGLLMCIGLDIMSIISADIETNLLQNLLTRSSTGILEVMGLYKKTDKLKDRLEEIILRQLSIVPTLENLYLMTNLELVICVYDIEDHKMSYISKDSHPDINCLDAVLLSSDILSIKNDPKLSRFIDGSFFNPYPIEKFDLPGESILGIIISTEYKYSYESKNILFRDIMLSINSSEIARRIINECSERCKHLVINVRNKSVYDTDSKICLVQDGIKDAEIFLDENCLSRKYPKEIKPEETSKEDETKDNFLEKLVIEEEVFYQEYSEKEEGEIKSDVKCCQEQSGIPPRKIRIKITPEMDKILNRHTLKREN